MKPLLCCLTLFGVTLAAPGLPESYLHGGVPATRGEYPFIVSLHFCLLTYCSHSCGATILTPSSLLSAAHCITELPGLGRLYAIAGILNQNDVNVERQYIQISGYTLHPDYQGGVNPHDIAILRLATSLVFSSLVQPARLPAPGADPEGPATLIGWGYYRGNMFPQRPNTLQKANAPVVPIDECDRAITAILQGGRHPLDLEANICSGPLNEPITVCSGDSGGPLLQDDVVIGVVSWGIVPCGRADAPSVYAKVSKYIDWILSNVEGPLLLA